ncbi:MAG: hypothetical protein B6D72_08125 [gamma proteobacterium symbiont of Ctena orbiculata]|nr:MAG: hypothetical protein B6D72_08125 [gamma proteobacterium symbiont of Ctena orbiculata]PVV23164.1 MAG: hypothetical protein B6D74_08255 [gamma proteobacterium symbiont of Ctena orbiculata]
MAEPNVASDVTPAMPTWRRVPELADLVEIFDPGMQVCTWQREIDPAIGAYLSELHQTGELQVVEALSSAAKPKLDCLPAGPGRAPLIDDLSLLREIVFELMGCSEVGLRLARVGYAMCPGWHVDRTSIRLVCTYQGPGTQWLDDQDVDRRDLHSGRMGESAFIQAVPGEIVLLKGALWQGCDAFGAVHRSPELAPDSALRTLVTLDPLWRA